MDTSRRRNFIVKGLLALAGGLLGRKALAAGEKPEEEGPLTTEGQILKSCVYKGRPPMEPLDTMIRFERSDETTGTVGTQEILSLMHEQKGSGTSYPWTIYSHLTTHHTGGDACVLCSRLTKNGPGWSCGLHSEVFNHARAVALGMNIEMTNHYAGPDETKVIGMNIQMLPGQPMQYGIQVHGEGHTEKGIGLNGIGDTGLDVAGKYATGIHMHGHEIALDEEGKVRVRYRDGRIEFLNGDKVIGHIDTDGEDHVL